MKEFLGFFPKEPSAYKHKIMKSLLAGMEQSVPSILDFLKLLDHSGFEPTISEVRKSIEKKPKEYKEITEETD